MASVRVNRWDPLPPPIAEVVITLSAEEAYKIACFFGGLSKNNMAEILHYKDRTFSDEVHNVTTSIYWQLSEEGVSEDGLR